MTLTVLADILMWCSIINMGLLLWWFLALLLMPDFIYSVHSKLFKIPREKFNEIHYRSMILFKIFVFVFNIVPFCALLIVIGS